LFSPFAESKPAFIVASFSSNLPDFFFYEMKEETVESDAHFGAESICYLGESYLPARPRLLPTPVTKSQPVFVVKLPAVPDAMSLKSPLTQLLAPLVPQMP